MHVRDARLRWARGSVGCGARLGRDVCAHGRVHGSVATHGLVELGLNFMDMTEPCGLFIEWSHATKSKGMQLNVESCN